MTWFWFWFAFVVANAAALGFYFALRLRPAARTVAWLACSTVIVLSPCLVPRSAPPLRFLDGVLAVTLCLKLYDAWCRPALAASMGAGRWLVYLPNWFWFVLQRVPRGRPPRRDWRRVAIDAPLMVAAMAMCALLLQFDWAGVPFALQHAAKVLAFAAAMMLIGRTFATLYRRLIMPARDPIDRPFTAPTPAEFWRRWNRPFRDFFDEHVFRPLGGARRPVLATLAVFAVSGLLHEYVFDVAIGHMQGWQMFFFTLQGIAAAATLRIRPRGWTALFWWAGTSLFNAATTVLFCRSVDGVIAFYQR